MVKLTEAQASLMVLLDKRLTPQQITAELGWSRSRFYAVQNELAALGLLRADGELPTGAESRVWPPAKWVDGCALALPELGWDAEEVRRMQRDQSRAGQFPPECDGRYIRSDWTGQAVRRVEWGDWVVQGLILPRLDSRYWIQATPEFRPVSLNNTPLLDVDDAGFPCWPTRGRVVPIDMIRRCNQAYLLDASPAEEVGLTIAVAWVMESRALLDVEVLDSLAIGGEPQ